MILDPRDLTPDQRIRWRRSDNARRFQFYIMQRISDEVFNGELTKDDVHELCKAKFLPKFGETSTTMLDTDEFFEYMCDIIKAFCYTYKIDL